MVLSRAGLLVLAGTAWTATAWAHAGEPIGAELRPARKYFRASGSWYQALEDRFHQVDDGRILAVPRTEAGRGMVERWAADLGLELATACADGEVELVVPASADPFELLESVESANWAASARFPLVPAGLEELMPDAMVVGGRRLRKTGGGWVVETDGREYEVEPKVLSLRFKAEVASGNHAEILERWGLSAGHRNRLGIYDVRSESRHAAEVFGELHGDESLEFVEVNTLGEYFGD
jgi:hypothetical protein